MASRKLRQKLAAYYMQPPYEEDDRPSFLGSLLGGAAMGGLAGGVGGAGYGGYGGYQAWNKALPEYAGRPHPLAPGRTNLDVLSDQNAPISVRESVAAGVPDKWSMIGQGALANTLKPALYGAGAGAAAGILRYLLSR